MTTPKSRTRAKEPAWTRTATVVRDERGRMASCLANAAAALRNDPKLAGLLAYDEMVREAVLMRPLDPPRGANSNLGFPRPLIDTDAISIQEYLQHNGLPRIGADSIFRAAELVARERSFHPVREYLNGLVWDGVARIDEWLTYYLGAEESLYHHEIGAMFLVAMVRRVFNPGEQSDYMMVLEGDQGEQKSTACRILAGNFYGDQLPSLRFGEQRASQYVKDKWLIEIGELSAFKGADADLLKTFLTRRVENYHEPYGRKLAYEPRQCLFIGTTNNVVYLDDPTGNRRFWPVMTGRLRLDELRADRDQLFAEAVVYHRAGANAYPDREFEAKYIKPQQEARQAVDPWKDEIAQYLIGKTRVRVSEIGKQALGIETERLGTVTNRRITSILTALRWHRGPAVSGVTHWIKGGKPTLTVIDGGLSAAS
jgi:predicted P-loop ATPase